MDILDTDALIVVDVQNDFCPGGALAVLGGDNVVPVINRVMTKFETVAFTRDWHPEDHCSFADQPEFVDGSWPPHCVQHSPGAEFHGDLRVPLDAMVIDKGADADHEQYSGFQNDALAKHLRERHISRVFVAGLATDYCVKFTALGAQEAGFEAVVIADGCRGVAEETTASALSELADAGIATCRSGDIVE